LRIRTAIKKVLFRNDFAFRHLDWLMQFYSVHVRDRLADVTTALNYYALGRRNSGKDMAFPPELYVTPASRCNASCAFCVYGRVQQTHTTLSLADFARVLDEFVSLGGRVVQFAPTLGEVLFDPTLFDKLGLCASRNLHVKLITNGYLLDAKDNARQLARARIQEVFLSVGDILPHIEAEIFGVSESAAIKKWAGVVRLLEAMQEERSGFILTLLMRPMRRYGAVLDDMKKTALWQHYRNGHFRIAPIHAYDNWGGELQQKDLVGIQRLRVGPKVKKYPCQYLQNLSILSSGRARLCACVVADEMEDGLDVGEVRDSTLLEIWGSEKRKQIVEAFRDGNPPEVCRKCSMYRPWME
jgi:MoaA/NifB/PqqE/SkfB family radical SAM enzyme